MKQDINNFIEEITNNFSELFVETFFIRYLSDYSKDDLLKNTIKAKRKLNEKIETKFFNKLNEFGIKDNTFINKKEE